MTDENIFIEKESAIKYWYYLICITLFLIHKSYFISFGSIIILFIISKNLFLIDNTVSKLYFKYSTLILTNKGSIKYSDIENVEKIEFSIFFECYKLKLYQYCNSNRCSNLEYGIKINLKNEKSIIVPSQNPEKLKLNIELQLKEYCI
jgi:hypothetical protein